MNYKLLAEKAKILNLMEIHPTGVLSIVCDTYDFFAVISKILPSIKEEIMARDGKIVVRPDSGDPADIICGYDYSDDLVQAHTKNKLYRNKHRNEFYTTMYQTDELGNSDGYVTDQQVPITNELKGAIEILWETFGGTTNKMGYKELDPHIGLIYGDAITLDRAENICERLVQKGFASTNWVAGIGSYTYQMVTRDTDGQAIKTTYVEFQEKEFGGIKIIQGGLLDYVTIGKNIFKDPKTDDGTKKSAKGLPMVYDVDGVLHLKDECTWEEEGQGLLRVIFEDGKLMNHDTLFDIRERIANINVNQDMEIV